MFLSPSERLRLRLSELPCSSRGGDGVRKPVPLPPNAPYRPPLCWTPGIVPIGFNSFSHPWVPSLAGVPSSIPLALGFMSLLPSSFVPFSQGSRGGAKTNAHLPYSSTRSRVTHMAWLVRGSLGSETGSPTSQETPQSWQTLFPQPSLRRRPTCSPRVSPPSLGE